MQFAEIKSLERKGSVEEEIFASWLLAALSSLSFLYLEPRFFILYRINYVPFFRLFFFFFW